MEAKKYRVARKGREYNSAYQSLEGYRGRTNRERMVKRYKGTSVEGITSNILHYTIG